MSRQIENLYKVRKKDIPKASVVLADAFQLDPVWTKIYEGESNFDHKFCACFETPIRYCLKYGEVYATSENLEGIAAWVPGDLADMSIWRIIRSGAMISAMKMGAKPAQKMKVVFEPLPANRITNMKGSSFIYLFIIGVASEFQGQGFGGKLLGALFEESENVGIPLYLETETEKNVNMYNSLGFKLLNQITLPVINLPMWEMVRKPKT